MTKYLIILMIVNCNSNKFDIRSAQTKPQSKIIVLGEIHKRDYQISNNIAQDLRDLVRFELINKGYNVDLFDSSKIPEDGKNEIQEESEIGQLPLPLRQSAGELYKSKIKSDINQEEVSKIIGSNNFNFYMKGSISRYENQQILEPENNFLIMIDVYDNLGKHKGIATATILVKENNQTVELKEATQKLIDEIKIKLLESN
ncbi:MAG: hypothetical protein MH321_03055 [Leptospiraceae bacterium]|nr:hypothetical protein [Leptospiraceae bacterium]